MTVQALHSQRCVLEPDAYCWCFTASLPQIGGDGLGDGILTELQGDGITTSHVLRAPGHPSPFTYIIVDRSGKSHNK
jgi:hypothetical protein